MRVSRSCAIIRLSFNVEMPAAGRTIVVRRLRKCGELQRHSLLPFGGSVFLEVNTTKEALNGQSEKGYHYPHGRPLKALKV